MNKSDYPAMLIKKLFNNFGLSVTDAAKLLKIGRTHLSNLINGKYSITPEMAIRLEKVFGISAKKLLKLQMDFDFENAKNKNIHLKRLSKKKINLLKQETK